MKLKDLLKKEKPLLKEDLYTTAGAMIPQIGAATAKNAEKRKKSSFDADDWKRWTKDDATEKQLIKVTDEYYKWLNSSLPALQKIYNSGPYQMHVSSLKSGGSSSDDYDFLGNLIRTMKNNKSRVEASK
jgi:hypothetical protein